jgi:hypothetical protein
LLSTLFYFILVLLLVESCNARRLGQGDFVLGTLQVPSTLVAAAAEKEKNEASPATMDPRHLWNSVSLTRDLLSNNTDESQSQSPTVLLLTSSQEFQIAFGTLLAILVVLLIGLTLVLVKRQKRPSLQLAQPSVLAGLILAGAFAIGSCYLLLPLSDLNCMLGGPFILTSLTVAGNILVGRIWRIILIMAPILESTEASSASSSSSSSAPNNWRKRTPTQHISKFLDTLVFGRKRKATLKQKVPLSKLIWLIVWLTLPQISWQACNLLIPSLQKQLQVIPVKNSSSFSSYNDAGVSVGRNACRTSIGGSSSEWPTWIGILLTLLPYLTTFYLSLHSSHRLPKIFDEAQAIKRSGQCVVWTVFLALPALYLADDPDARVYLTAFLVFSMVLPPCWWIVYSKVYKSRQEDSKGKGGGGSMIVRDLLRRTNNSAVGGAREQRQDEYQRMSKLALISAKILEEQGLVQQSIQGINSALQIWECDPARDGKEKIGGFTVDEINNFSHIDLACILRLQMAKGRAEGTFYMAQVRCLSAVST